MDSLRKLTIALLSWTHISHTTAQTYIPQTDTFNSTFSLSKSQITAAKLDNTTAHNIEISTRFQQTNWAGSSCLSDSFYTPPKNSTHLPPGSLLKLEEFTNTSLYALPPNTGLSRFMFQSETYNGSLVPVSGFVLWPWMPKEDPRKPGKLAVVGWAHGLSGVFGECAPSHYRNLWYQYSATYTLALQGYVVVAPDYAGLGVSKRYDGTEIKHQIITPAQSNDLIYAVQAAQSAFPVLSENFVLMGHSQGGYTAWSAAETLAKKPVSGYLGTVAASPATNLTALLTPESQVYAPVVAFLANMMDTVFPSFQPKEFLTKEAIRKLNLLRDISSCDSLFDMASVKASFSKTWYFRQFSELMSVGGKPFAGPMLVLQGTADGQVLYDTTSASVNATCGKGSSLKYHSFEGVDHLPTMYASQRIWLDWIADRFEGKKVSGKCKVKHEKPWRPVETYQKELGYYLSYMTQAYQATA